MKILYIQDGVLTLGTIDPDDFIAKNQQFLAHNRLSYGDVSDEVMRDFYEMGSGDTNLYALLVNGEFTHDDNAIVDILRPFGIENYRQVAEYYASPRGFLGEIRGQVTTYFFRYFSNEEYSQDLLYFNHLYNDEGEVVTRLDALIRHQLIDEILKDLD